MFTFWLKLYFRVFRRSVALSLAVAVISASQGRTRVSGGCQPSKQKKIFRKSEEIALVENIMEYVFPCSPQNVTKAINQENNNEGLEKDEQDSFKLYLKRVKDCLAGRSKDDSMERLDTIIISVYKFQGEGCC